MLGRGTHVPMDVGRIVNIRLALDKDLETIVGIWFEGLEASFPVGSFEKSNIRQRFRENFDSRKGIFNYWVAEDKDRILGWQSLSQATTNPLKENLFAESSTYVRKEARALGVAEKLLSYVIDEARLSDLRYLVAYVAKDNLAVRKLAVATGWVEIGELPTCSDGKTGKPKLFIVRLL
jgi:L-amino acid N-acyltransferase YncA